MAGVMPRLQPLLTTMRGRMVHDANKPGQFNAYGQRADEVIWSVSRSALTAALTEAAHALPNIRIHFGQQCLDYRGAGRLRFRALDTGVEHEHNADRIIAADGAGSTLRAALAISCGFTVDEVRLPHDYKELHIPAHNGVTQLATDALHIWPRGGHMLIALPNADNSFTATLFLPAKAAAGQPGLDVLHDAAQVADFFNAQYREFPALVPDLGKQFLAHPQGMLGTVYCPQWHDGERLLLLGDAAHAIVPFHGQGMNCAFEDCRLLDEMLAVDSGQAFRRFAESRRADCAAIARMALENYDEMRDAVRSPQYLQQRQLALALEREFPERFIPRYAMVMFRDDIPYSVAERRGQIQQQILDELTADATTAVDAARVRERVESRLVPLPAAVR
jgi:kynurenine 3-monooxygenase